MWIAILILIMAAALVLAGCRTTRAGYESAPYTVVLSNSNIEIRNYPALTVVETPMASSGLGAAGSFNRLFHGYFDPPWTPALLRRNEVMVRTESGV